MTPRAVTPVINIALGWRLAARLAKLNVGGLQAESEESPPEAANGANFGTPVACSP